MPKLRPFREVPRDLREWTKWMRDQELTDDDLDVDTMAVDELTANTATLGDVTITGSFELTDTFWDDMRFPASAINPPGQASDPDFDTTNGGWLFAAGSTELLFLAAQMPHQWKEGTPLKPHVHWQKSTSAGGNVLWRLSYKKAPIGEVMDVAFTDLDVTTPVAGTPDNDTANEHLISSFGDISMVGNKLSDMFLLKLQRIGGDGSDTYGADCRLLEFDIHFEIDGFGSGETFNK